VPGEGQKQGEPERVGNQQRDLGIRAEHRRQEVRPKRRAQEIGGSADVIGERPRIVRHVAKDCVADLPINIRVEETPLSAEREQHQSNDERDGERPVGHGRKIGGKPGGQGRYRRGDHEHQSGGQW
jgi:hypothetical protein